MRTFFCIFEKNIKGKLQIQVYFTMQNKCIEKQNVHRKKHMISVINILLVLSFCIYSGQKIYQHYNYVLLCYHKENN